MAVKDNSENLELTELENTPELFKQALYATADGVVITDVAGTIKWVNPAYEELTGYSRDEILNQNHRILKSGKQDPSFYKKLWTTILAGKLWKGELWNVTKQGVVYLEEQSITPVKDKQGNITYFIAIKRNITQQYEIQKKVNLSNRIDSISQLTAGIAHNFNNKLASILGFADLALDDIKQYKNDDLEDSLVEIITAGKMARDLVRQMMAFSVEEVSDPKPTDIEIVIKEAVKFMFSTLPAGINFHVNVAEMPLVNIDPVRLHQMLITLAINASDSMDGNGEIAINVNKVHIQDHICSSCHKSFSGEYINVSVTDSGKGISEENLENIFMPFFTTYQQEGRIGMGLSALHGMLHDMEAHILVESTPSKCSEFRLLFPFSESEPEQAIELEKDTNKMSETTYKDKMHILVVDDDESVVNFLSEILKINGYEVTQECDSKQALRMISENPTQFDLLITDQSMPKLSGLGLIEMVSELRKDLPAILMTGYDERDFSGKSDYVSAVLAKPFDTKELLQKIRAL